MEGGIASEGLCCLAEGICRFLVFYTWTKGEEQSWPGWALAHLDTSG